MPIEVSTRQGRPEPNQHASPPGEAEPLVKDFGRSMAIEPAVDPAQAVAIRIPTEPQHDSFAAGGGLIPEVVVMGQGVRGVELEFRRYAEAARPHRDAAPGGPPRRGPTSRPPRSA